MEICINNSLEEMSNIVSMVEEFGFRNGIPEAIINDMNLALDEVVNNIISYGYPNAQLPNSQTGYIAVRLTCSPMEMSAEISDDGIAFNPLLAGMPDLRGTVETRAIGGIGLLFVRALMDSVHYDRVENRNRLRITKAIPPAGQV
jgi:anti-sigma regulatory factor (Ser/Thr protein kinase)